MKQSELLAPAGTLKNMRYAFAYGADAVYAGQPRYSLRVRNNDFNTLDNLQAGIDEAHARNKLFYLASNIAPHNRKVRTYMDDIAPVIEMQPDALIMSDPGLIMMVRERWPEQEIHLSVQANVVNYAAAKFWQSMGISRIILSRELSLDEVAEFRQECPDLELEVFVHGALCIAYSGRCLLSGYMNWRDPNQGTCTNACRWQYSAVQAEETAEGDVVAKAGCQSQGAVQGADQAQGTWQPEPKGNGGDVPVFLLEESNRPGEQMAAYEDEHGTYIMNSKDLRAVQHVQRLMEIGVDSLKIEGRTKSHYYVARTAQVYRRAIDDAMAGKGFDMNLMAELEGLASRGYTEGFYRRHVPAEYQNYTAGSSKNDRQQFVGEVLEVDSDKGVALVDVKNRFAVGDELELMLPGGNQSFRLETLESRKGEAMEVAPGSGHVVRVPLPEAVATEQADYGLLVKYLD